MRQILCLSLFLMVVCACQEDFATRLEKDTRGKTERDCPQRLDEVTTLDSIVFHNDGSADYKLFFTLDVDSAAAVAFGNIRNGELRSTLLQGVRNDIDLRKIKEHKLNIVYFFRVKDTGNDLGEIRFTAKDYE